jgi:hypothetical protein
MQITIVQSEIEQAIKQFVLGRLNVEGASQKVSVELKATRGETGMQAIIDIELDNTVRTNRVPTRVVTPTPVKVVTTADLKKMHEEEAAAEAAAEAESTGEEAPEAVEVEETPAVEETPEVVEEAPEEAPEPAPAPVIPVVAPKPQTPRPATQVAGAPAGAPAAPPKRLFSGFSRPNNTAS